jgi:hypothetical protein
MACSPLKVNRCFGETCLLHLQGWRISQARNQHKAGSRSSIDFQQTTWRYIPEDIHSVTIKFLDRGHKKHTKKFTNIY